MPEPTDLRSEFDANGLKLTTQVRLFTPSSLAVDGALSAVHAMGMAGEADPTDAALYETRVAENHNHVICRVCGKNADVWNCVVGMAPGLSPSETGGFLIDEAEVTFWGTCPDCQQLGPIEGLPHAQRLLVLAVPDPSSRADEGQLPDNTSGR